MRPWWLLVLTACGRLDFDDQLPGDASGPNTDGSPDGAPPAGLYAYWTFDEGTGTTASDATGHGHALMLVNGTTWTSGITGTGVHTNGTNQYLVSTSPLDLSSTSAVTL